MKKHSLLSIGVISIAILSSCVENSQKYKTLLAKADSLMVVANNQNAEMESLLAGLNEISAGMQSIREAENLLALQSATDKKRNKTKEQIEILKNDIQAISDAINGYKEQIAQLESKNKRQSAEFKKLIANLKAELEKSSETIQQLNEQVNAQTKEIGIKTQQIADLNENVANLEAESTSQKETIASQDKALNTVHYLLGTRKELKDANVISRQGIFCPPIVSTQAQNAQFADADGRELKTIPLNCKKAKILSSHPEASYTLSEGEDGMLTLSIDDPANFWKQTRYLVIMVN